MLHPPALRLKIDANLADGSPLYVLTLDGLSIVAALRELSWQLDVSLGESFLEESEYAATLIEVLSPMAMTTRLLRPGTQWNSHATIRLHTENRVIEDNDEAQAVVLIEFSVHDIEFSDKKLHGVSPGGGAVQN